VSGGEGGGGEGAVIDCRRLTFAGHFCCWKNVGLIPKR
jgi:hypothetical protein